MFAHTAKTLFDLEKQNFDSNYQCICLEENRTHTNIQQCQKSIETMKHLLNNLTTVLQEVVNGNE